MNIISRINKAFCILRQNPQEFVCSIISRFGFFIPDTVYLKIVFKLKMGYPLDLKNPKTFNEKLQWLKIHDRQIWYSHIVDKYSVKEYVAKKIGSQYIIPTLGVWDTFEEIDFDTLPNRFVLKTTHGGGSDGVVICKDKQTFDFTEARDKILRSMKNNIYRNNMEWPYKYVEKRIIAETFLGDMNMSQDEEIKDYKFYCFNGKALYYKIDFDRFVSHQANFYNRNSQLMPFGFFEVPPDPLRKITIPDNIDEMIHIADALSEGFPFIRVDLYNVNGKIFFGELTFYTAGGFEKYTDENWDRKLGQLLKLPKDE